ncbi:MAG: hypothetical protein WCQ80_05340 [Bacilli bacterium]
MFLMQIEVTQWLIVVGAILFFTIPFLINRKIEVPKGTVLPDKCTNCTIDSCFVKSLNGEDVKDQLRAEMEKCEVPDETI